MGLTDPHNLTISTCCQLLNSTQLGTIITPRVLRAHYDRAGLRMGDGKRVDLAKYARWLFWQLHTSKPKEQIALTGYDAVKEAARQRAADLSLTGRDIGELPAIVDSERKKQASSDLRFFCKTYFPETFSLPWSDDHLRVIAKMQTAIRTGGLFAMAMPRGGGKTSLCESACLWAILYGHCEFVVIIGADERAALETLESIQTEMETNELLLADFPEAVYPIHKLERIAQRANGQLYKGVHTRIEWTDHQIVLPTISGSAASGAIIRVAGITGRVRGMKYKRADGSAARPDLALIDDPQTDESANSIKETGDRLKIVCGAVLKLAGPGRKISAFLPCTVIAREDLADQVLNRDRFPDWQGERMKMLYAFPRNAKLWAEYESIRADELKAERGLAKATEFYRARMSTCGLPLNRARPCDKCKRRDICMDAGAIVAWPARFNHDEASGLQNAMNLKFQNEESFASECQNEPKQIEADEVRLTADEVAAKVNGYERGVVPLDATRVTAYVDVMDKALFWVVTAWRDDFTGYVLDYGTFPEQDHAYFSTREITNTLARAFPKAAMTGRVFSGLSELTERLISRAWECEDGAGMWIQLCPIDANWGQSSDVIYQFCRQSPHAAVLLPSHGVGLGPAAKPFADYVRKHGERIGHHWRIPSVRGKRIVKYALIDVNYWKSFIHERFGVALGDAGCLSLFKAKPAVHRLFGEHITAEYRVSTSARGRTVDEWKEKPSHPDNHWFDCLVGCAVAASIGGSATHGHEYVRQRRKVVSFAKRYQRV